MNLFTCTRITIIFLFCAIYSIGIVHSENNTTTEANKIGNEPNSSTSATIYTESNFWGIWWTLTVGKCTDVPGLLYKKTSSIDTHDNCMILYSLQHCKGKHVKIAPGTDGHSHLSEVDFDNTLASLKSCENAATAQPKKQAKRTRRNVEGLSTLLEVGRERETSSEQPQTDSSTAESGETNQGRNDQSSRLFNINIADFLDRFRSADSRR